MSARERAAAGYEDVAAVFQDPADHLLDDVRHRQGRGTPVRAAGVGIEAQRAAPAALVPGDQAVVRDDQGLNGPGADRDQAGGQADYQADAGRRQVRNRTALQGQQQRPDVRPDAQHPALRQRTRQRDDLE